MSDRTGFSVAALEEAKQGSRETSAGQRPDRIETFGDITEEGAIVYGWRNNTACAEVIIRVRDREGREWEGSTHVDVAMRVTKDIANGK